MIAVMRLRLDLIRVTIVLVCALAVTAVSAQTKITAPRNKYAPADDVKLGKEAAAEATKELPMLGDQRLEDYVERVGRTLAKAIPPEFQHSEFTYTFDVVNQKEINAFALPGGPMFLNRGMIEASKTEGEMAGVMAHELSHVALRHGTAQATEGQGWKIGSVVGQILGGILGGTTGAVLSQGSQIFAGGFLLKYSRAYESQADILGAQILARAGYDPRDMANMFKTIEAEGGSRGPDWLSSHPNPGDRYDAIMKEAQYLDVRGHAETGDFDSIQARLKGMPPAYTAEQIAKGQAKSGPQTTRTSSASARVTVAPPSSQYRSSRPFAFLRLNLPTNWAEVSGGDSGVTYSPDGGYQVTGDRLDGFSHGLQIGVVPQGTGNLQRDTEALLASFVKSNPNLRRQSGYVRESLSGRASLRTTISNQSDLTGQPETVSLTTTLLQDGRLLYFIGVSPERDAAAYEDAFRRVRRSVQLNDR